MWQYIVILPTHSYCLSLRIYIFQSAAPLTVIMIHKNMKRTINELLIICILDYWLRNPDFSAMHSCCLWSLLPHTTEPRQDTSAPGRCLTHMPFGLFSWEAPSRCHIGKTQELLNWLSLQSTLPFSALFLEYDSLSQTNYVGLCPDSH